MAGSRVGGVNRMKNQQTALLETAPLRSIDILEAARAFRPELRRRLFDLARQYAIGSDPVEGLRQAYAEVSREA